MRRRPRTALASALLGGFVAGTVDIVAAALISRQNPIVITQYIAAGLLGRRSLELGFRSASLGLVVQWALSILIALIFAFAAQKLTALTRRWVLSGIAYGIVTFFVMNYAVLPLSALHRTPHFSWPLFAENLGAMMVFGLIVAFFARDTYRPGHISMGV